MAEPDAYGAWRQVQQQLQHHRQQQQPPDPSQQGHKQQQQQRTTPPMWLVVWVAVASEWLRGYMGGMFFGAKIILSPRWRSMLLNTHMHVNKKEIVWDPTSLRCKRFEGAAPRPDQEAGVTTSELLFPLLGAALAGWLTRRVGRRTSVMIGIVLMCVGQLMAGITAQYPIYIVGSDIYSGGSVMVMQAMLIEVIEVVPTTSRGWLTSLGGVASSVGFVMAGLVVLAIQTAQWSLAKWQWGFRLSLLMGIWPAVLLLLVVPWMLDTPSSLLQRGRLHEARQALQSLRGEFSDVREEYEAAAKAVSEGKGRTQLSLLSEPQQRPALILTVCLAVFSAALDPRWIMDPDTNLFGATAAVVQMPVLYTTLLPSIAGVTGAVICCFIVDRIGRRGLMAGSAAALAVLAAALAGMMGRYVRTVAQGRDWDAGVGGVMLLLLYLIHLISNVGWGSANLILVAELQTINTRSAGVATHLGLQLVIYRSVHHLMTHQKCDAQLVAVAVYSGMAALAAVFAWLLVPETKLTPLDAIPRQCVFTHWLWHRFAPLAAASLRRHSSLGPLPPAAQARSGAWGGVDGSGGGGRGARGGASASGFDSTLADANGRGAQPAVDPLDSTALLLDAQREDGAGGGA